MHGLKQLIRVANILICAYLYKSWIVKIGLVTIPPRSVKINETTKELRLVQITSMNGRPITISDSTKPSTWRSINMFKYVFTLVKCENPRVIKHTRLYNDLFLIGNFSFLTLWKNKNKVSDPSLFHKRTKFYLINIY